MEDHAVPPSDYEPRQVEVAVPSCDTSSTAVYSSSQTQATNKSNNYVSGESSSSAWLVFVI